LGLAFSRFTLSSLPFKKFWTVLYPAFQAFPEKYLLRKEIWLKNVLAFFTYSVSATNPGSFLFLTSSGLNVSESSVTAQGVSFTYLKCF